MQAFPDSLRYLLVLIGLAGLLVACQNDATPIPAVLPPTPTATPEPTTIPPVRYALTVNTSGFVPDLALLQANAQVVQLTDDTVDVASYDIVVSYGIISGWTPSPVTLHVALIINDSPAPMDNVLAASIARHSPDPPAILSNIQIPGTASESIDTVESTALRTQLANAGYPDGFDLTLMHVALPGIEVLISQLEQSNLFIQPATIRREDVARLLAEDRAHLIVTFWTTDEERAALLAQVGDNNLIDLYSIPVSYQAAGDLTLSFTPGGFPIGIRAE